jgi:UDP-3-O-[3-hydroxymyristoyl] glucosamine N-acyltransferase
VLAGQVGLVDNIEIGERTMVGAQAGVASDVAANQRIVGSPATDAKEMLRIVGFLKRLPKMSEQLKQLSAKVENLEASKDDKK